MLAHENVKNEGSCLSVRFLMTREQSTSSVVIMELYAFLENQAVNCSTIFMFLLKLEKVKNPMPFTKYLGIIDFYSFYFKFTGIPSSCVLPTVSFIIDDENCFFESPVVFIVGCKYHTINFRYSELYSCSDS